MGIHKISQALRLGILNLVLTSDGLSSLSHGLSSSSHSIKFELTELSMAQSYGLLLNKNDL